MTAIGSCVRHLLWLGFFLLLFTLPGYSQPYTACGGLNQRACCPGENTIYISPQDPLGICQAGYTPIVPCNGDCRCASTSLPAFSSSLGVCVQLSQCGGQGQPSCLGANSTEFCNPGLTMVNGCSGDCLSGANTTSTHMCSALQGMTEPGTNVTGAPATPAPPDPKYPLTGYADNHLHLFGHMAFGGGLLAGTLVDPIYGANGALEPDKDTYLPLVISNDLPNGTDLFTPCGPYIPYCPSYFFHEVHDLFNDPIGNGTKDGAAGQDADSRFYSTYNVTLPDSNYGAPVFSGWPQWSSTSHEQTYNVWLKRAWQGGLRLITVQLSTNEALCRGNRHLPEDINTFSSSVNNCYNSMGAIDQQIVAAWVFQCMTDGTNWANGDSHPCSYYFTNVSYEQALANIATNPLALQDGPGWFRIVRTPLQARQVIAAGKLAVVLGIEVDNPFGDNGGTAADSHGCRYNDGTGVAPFPAPPIPDCTDINGVEATVDKYYSYGIRHVFPVHDFNNAFGGAATWYNGMEAGQRVVEGHWWQTRECANESFGHHQDATSTSDTWGSLLLRFIADFPSLIFDYPSRPEIASCNTDGLYTLGKALIPYLWQKGMIVDVDHMSEYAINDTLNLAEAQNPVMPVFASHVQVFDLHQQAQRHERMRTIGQLQRIRDDGGMVSAMLKDDVQDTDDDGLITTVPYANATAPDDCSTSSKSFLQALEYLQDTMGGPVSLGSDFNGVAAHIGPRFGTWGCNLHTDQRALQYRDNNMLKYPFALPGSLDPNNKTATFGSFSPQQTGEKSFNFNSDGLAHIGLYPDLVADMVNNLGLNPLYLYRSAESYIRVWERTRQDQPQPGVPTDTQIGSITVPSGNLYPQSTIPFSVTVNDPTDDPSVITYAWNWGDGSPTTTVTGSAGATQGHEYGNTGQYTVTVRVTGPMAFAATSTTIQVNPSTGFSYIAPSTTEAGVKTRIYFYTAPNAVIDVAACTDMSSGSFTGTQQGPVQTVSDPNYEQYGIVCTYPSGSSPAFKIQAHVTDFSNNTSYAGTGPNGSSQGQESNIPITMVTATAPTILNLPPDGQVFYTATSSKLVIYDPLPSAVDSFDGTIPLNCSWPGVTSPAGATFLPGVTTVNCSATNQAGLKSTGTFGVTVRTVPQITLPDMTPVPATSSAGVSVTFNVSVTDAQTNQVTLSCSLLGGTSPQQVFNSASQAASPVSGSTTITRTFPLGASQVSCSATNSAGVTTTDSFTVNVYLCPTTVTSSITVTRGAQRFGVAQNAFLQTDTLKNTSGSAIPAPLYLVLDGLPAGVSLLGASGQVTNACIAPDGSPFITVLTTGSLATGGTLSVPVQFSDPTKGPITYTTRAFSQGLP